MEDFTAKAGARGMTLKNDAPSALGVKADPDRLRQVLSNLIDNAIKYGRTDGTVRVTARPTADRRIEFLVSDDGPGIPEGSKDRLFERFYRADKARSREQGGTGLGLAIVKHVVQAHGGEITVTSEPGKGGDLRFFDSGGLKTSRSCPRSRSQRSPRRSRTAQVLRSSDSESQKR